jgi:hypothetical protein
MPLYERSNACPSGWDLALEDRLTPDNPSGSIIAGSEGPFRVMNWHGSRKTKIR